MSFDPRKVLADMAWRPIETAPKDGTHFLAANFSPGSIGFGYFGGSPVPVPWRGVVHWWAAPGEEGFYLSSGGIDEPMVGLTDWMPLPPLDFHLAGQSARNAI